jgi:hypothetical protein
MAYRYAQVHCGACKRQHDVYAKGFPYPYLITEFKCPVNGKNVYFTIPESPAALVDVIPEGAVVVGEVHKPTQPKA